MAEQNESEQQEQPSTDRATDEKPAPTKETEAETTSTVDDSEEEND